VRALLVSPLGMTTVDGQDWTLTFAALWLLLFLAILKK
jgi:hypothetical protein